MSRALLALGLWLLAVDALQTPPSALRRATQRRRLGAAPDGDAAPPDAAPPAAAPPPAAVPPAEEVDALTYVFGAPGELAGDLERLGTSPRRIATFGFLGLAVALAGDLFGVTSALLTAAPGPIQSAARGARLDTYYMMGPLKRYVDDEFGYEVRYPKAWLGDQSVYVARTMARAGNAPGDADALLRSRAPRRAAPAAVAAFGPPRGTFAENLSIFRSELPAATSLRAFGEPGDFARRLLETSIAPPASGKTAELLGASERPDGAYAFEYRLTLPASKGGRVLRNLAVVAVRGGRALLTLTVLCDEGDWPAREAEFRAVADSFRLL